MLSYKNFVLISPNQDQKKQIGQLIDGNNGSIFHEITLNEIVASHFITKLYYLVDDPANITILSPVHKENMESVLSRYHFKPLSDIPYSGIVGDHIIDYKNLSIGFFESINYVGFPNEKKTNVGAENGKVGETAMVDLSLDEDEIFTKVINSKRRNMIRKALKEGIKVKQYFTNEGLNEFWPILKQLHNKLGYNRLTFDYYNEIMKNYGHKNKAFILVAFKDGVAISGVFILGNKNFMHYYKGASLFSIRNEGHGELLQWEAIKLSKLLGSKTYDLCNLNKEKLPNIYKFKTGISKEIFQYPVYLKNSAGFKVINKIKKFL